jgi:hypothetical protein
LLPSAFITTDNLKIYEKKFSACPSNEWLLKDGICYLADSTISKPWDDAVLWCIARNSLLVYPKTNTEKNVLINILQRYD